MDSPAGSEVTWQFGPSAKVYDEHVSTMSEMSGHLKTIHTK